MTEIKKSLKEQDFFGPIFDVMLEGIQVHDFEWRYIYVNDALLKYSQYPREELLGYTLMEKYPGIEQSDLFKVFDRCMKERVSDHLTTEFTFPNGVILHFELSIQPVPQGIFILSIDITEKKKAEEKIKKLNEELERKVLERTTQLEEKIIDLKKSEEKFIKIFQASAAGMSITRIPESVYVDVNDSFATLIGYTKQEIIGRTSIELGIIVENEKREAALKQIRKQGYLRHFEMVIRHRSGKHINILSSIETIWISGVQYAINVIFDITERKLAEEQLAIVNRELEAFTYSVSHDLRAPLRAVIGYANILLEDYDTKLDPEGKRYLHTITESAIKMGKLMDDLLEFSRLGRKDVVKAEVDPSIVIQVVIDELKKAAYYKANIIVGKMPIVKADYSLLHQVIYNLVSNAVKYSSKKGEPLITIEAEKKHGEVVFSIRDNGAGFDMKYYSKLFGVFNRLHMKEEFEGTGVGLAVVQRIVTKHGGRVWAEGEVNKGAVFYFSLPEQD